MSERNIVGNGSTLIKYICFLIAGRLIAVAIAHGISIPVDQYTLAELIGYVIGFIGATIDARYPNSINWKRIQNILNKPVQEEPEEEIFDNDAPVLNDEYITDDESC